MNSKTDLLSRCRVGDLVTIRNEYGAMITGKVESLNPVVARGPRGNKWAVGVSDIVRLQGQRASMHPLR